MVGWRRLGLDRTNLEAWHEFLAVGDAALLFGVIQYSRHIGGFAEAMGLVLAALDEEIVYRLAVLILVGAIVAKLDRSQLAQRRGLGRRVPASPRSSRRGSCSPCCPVTSRRSATRSTRCRSSCSGMVLGYAMLRTGALLPAVVVHALLNLATIAAFEGEISAALRSDARGRAPGRARARHRRGRTPARHLPAGAGRRARPAA